MPRPVIRIAATATLLGAVLCVGATRAEAQGVVTLRADAWCPYNCDPAAADPGYIIEIAKETLGKAGFTVDYKTQPWSRALQDVKDGKFDGAVGASKDDAQGYVFPAVPLGIAGNTFISQKAKNITIKSVADLEKFSLGAIRDYAYVTDVDAYIKKNEKNEARVRLFSGDEPLKLMIRNLEAGRIDMIIENTFVLSYTLRTMGGLPNMVQQSYGEGSEVSIAFSPNNPKSQQYAKIIGDGIVAMRASGKLTPILAKYGITDWNKGS